MNELIQKLADEAEEYADAKFDQGGEFHIHYTQKLAELVVEECMTAILKESKWYWDREEFQSSDAIQNAARRVQEHFGGDK